MNSRECVRALLKEKNREAVHPTAEAFAPVNIALVKYWGKRDGTLNLPVTGSVSLTFPEWGTTTTVRVSQSFSVVLNEMLLSLEAPFVQRLKTYINLFEFPFQLSIITQNNVPTGAGVASSASGFAALMKALDGLCGWKLSPTEMSVLARLGSGSACRSFWSGFVKWRKGTRSDGMDSHGVPISGMWPSLRAGIVLVEDLPKSVSSRHAMDQTTLTSSYYRFWPEMVEQDTQDLHVALEEQNLERVGAIMERQALSLHWLMGTSAPPILYTQPSTIAQIEKIHALRAAGHQIYWTQDAGPNIKVLFDDVSEQAVRDAFPTLLLSVPFKT